MFRRFCTLFGTCAFLALATLQTPAFARDRTAGAEQPDTTFWMTIKDTDLPDLFEMFIKRYPDSAHRPKAERQLRKLQGSARPSAMDQAKALIKKAPDRASLTRSVATANTPRTRAPALGAPVLAAAPVASAAAAKAAPASQPVVSPEPVMTTTAPEDDVAEQEVANEAQAEPARQKEEILDDELIVLLQHHLSRVGCRKGSLDGVWGPVSQKAAERFAKAVNEPLVTISPTTRLLRSVKSYEAGVCSGGAYRDTPAVRRPVATKRKTIPRRAIQAKRRLKRVKARRVYKKHKIVTTNRRIHTSKPRPAKKLKRRRKIVRQATKHKKIKKLKKAKVRRKVKVATKHKARKRKIVRRTVKKIRRKKSGGSNHDFVGGDPFNASLRAVGATAGGGRGGGWN